MSLTDTGLWHRVRQKQGIEAGHEIPEVDAFISIGNGYPLPRARFRQVPTCSSRAIEQDQKNYWGGSILAFFSSIGTIQFEKAKVYYDY